MPAQAGYFRMVTVLSDSVGEFGDAVGEFGDPVGEFGDPVAGFLPSRAGLNFLNLPKFLNLLSSASAAPQRRKNKGRPAVSRRAASRGRLPTLPLSQYHRRGEA